MSGSRLSGRPTATGAAEAAAVSADRLAALYAAHWPATLRVITAQVRRGDHHIAEDLAQEAFLRAWPALHTVRNEAATPAWLAAIARRVVTNHYRGPGHRPSSRVVREVPLASDSPLWQARRARPLWEPTPNTAAADAGGHRAEQATRRWDVAAALAALPEQTRQVMVVRFGRGLSIRAAAAELGCSQRRICQHSVAGLSTLRAQLAEAHGASPTTTAAMTTTATASEPTATDGDGLTRARAAVAELGHRQHTTTTATAPATVLRRARAAQLAGRRPADTSPAAGRPVHTRTAAGRGGPAQEMDVGRGAG